jgi:Uma2 family endonuclease
VRRVAMSEAEYYALPDARVEYVEGEALFMSPVSLPHARLNVFLVSYLNRVARSTGVAEVFADTFAVRLSQKISRVPDLSVVLRNGRAVVRETHIEGPPDLIVEIVSAESRDRDYREKYFEYESAGVTEYVIVDPVYQTIDLHRLEAGKYVRVAEENGAVASAVLPGLLLRAEWLKQSPLPDPATLP